MRERAAIYADRNRVFSYPENAKDKLLLEVLLDIREELQRLRVKVEAVENATWKVG